MNDIRILRLAPEDFSPALELAWEVFSQFDAAECTEDGVQEFHRSIHDPAYCAALTIYGAFQDDALVGMLALQNGGTHIALFFVRADFQRRGVGTKLFRAVAAQCDHPLIVYAAGCAVPFYRKLGFWEVEMQQEISGIRFTPMIYIGGAL